MLGVQIQTSGRQYPGARAAGTSRKLKGGMAEKEPPHCCEASGLRTGKSNPHGERVRTTDGVQCDALDCKDDQSHLRLEAKGQRTQLVIGRNSIHFSVAPQGTHATN